MLATTTLLQTRCRIWKFWKKKKNFKINFFSSRPGDWKPQNTHFLHFLKENSPPKNKQNTHETGDLRTIKCQMSLQHVMHCKAHSYMPSFASLSSPFQTLLFCNTKSKGRRRSMAKLLDSITLRHPHTRTNRIFVMYWIYL